MAEMVLPTSYAIMVKDVGEAGLADDDVMRDRISQVHANSEYVPAKTKSEWCQGRIVEEQFITGI